jgi:hypothetical protein
MRLPFLAVLCGQWETYPREFAKCRRCRKAKYCGKECQSTAWSQGHRFWCSAKEDADSDVSTAIAVDVPSASAGGNNLTVTSGGSRERHIVHRALANVAVTGQDTTQAARSAVATLRAAANPAVPPTPPPHVLPNRPVAATRPATLLRNRQLYGRPAAGTSNDDMDTLPFASSPRGNVSL